MGSATSADRLQQRGIVREQGQEAYDFTHDKLREVAYHNLSRVKRRWLHRRIAAALEVLHAEELDAVSGQIAVHWQRGYRPRQAVPYHQRALAVAARLYGSDEALRYCQQLLHHASLQRLPSTETAKILLDLGQVWQARGHYQEAESLYRHALSHAGTNNDPNLHARFRQALATLQEARN